MTITLTSFMRENYVPVQRDPDREEFMVRCTPDLGFRDA